MGRLLRAIHVDEFAQFLNILKGERPAVGPRPERLEFVEELADETATLLLSKLVRRTRGDVGLGPCRDKPGWVLLGLCPACRGIRMAMREINCPAAQVARYLGVTTAAVVRAADAVEPETQPTAQ